MPKTRLGGKSYENYTIATIPVGENSFLLKNSKLYKIVRIAQKSFPELQNNKIRRSPCHFFFFF